MAGKRKNIIGQKFHHLTVKSEAGFNNSCHSQSNCECDCGNMCIVRNADLKAGKTKTCGKCILRREDLTGQRFKYLTVESDAGFSASGAHQSNCICDCGNKTVVANSNLKNGNTESCGKPWACEYAYIISSSANTINATTHGLSNTKQYYCWHNFNERCYNPDDPMFPNYGGKTDANGNSAPITVYKAWREDFLEFYNYVEYDPRMPETLAQFEARNPGKRAVIDRIDNDGNYEPGNIRWATDQESAQNRSNNVFNPEMVIFIKTETKKGKTLNEIHDLLIKDYNYQGKIDAIRFIIEGKTWTNINS